MDTKYKDFCDNYKEKLVLDEDIATNEIALFRDYRHRVHFELHMTRRSPTQLMIFGNPTQRMFTLDDEDIQYLYNKYSKKIQAERDANIAELKTKYEETLGRS